MVSCVWEERKLNVFYHCSKLPLRGGTNGGEDNQWRLRENQTKRQELIKQSLLCCDHLIISSKLLTDRELQGFILRVFRQEVNL